MSPLPDLTARISALVAQVPPVPEPTPSVPPAEAVTPGVGGFLFFAFMILAVLLLGFDFMRRARRARYRELAQAEIAAELSGETVAPEPASVDDDEAAEDAAAPADDAAEPRRGTKPEGPTPFD